MRDVPKRDDDTNRQSLILDTAVRLYARQGFENVTFNNIADEAGVATSLIRHYFGSKENFRNSSHRYVLDEVKKVFEHIESFFDDQAGANELDRAVNELINSLRERSHLLRYLARLFMAGDSSANALFQEYYQLILSYIKRLEASDQLKPEISPVWLAFNFMYMQLGTAFLQDQIEYVRGVNAYDLDETLNRNLTAMNIMKFGAFKNT